LTFPFDEKIGAPAAHQSVSTLFALVLFISAQDKHTQGKIQKTEDAETYRKGSPRPHPETKKKNKIKIKNKRKGS
jgi:hypothetical protein